VDDMFVSEDTRIMGEGRIQDETDLAGDDERNRLDDASAELVRPCDLALGDVQSAAQEEAHVPLGVCRLVFCE
jgi:hypothetical protein